MKNALLIALLLCSTLQGRAQEEEEYTEPPNNSFLNKVFVGGGINIGFGTGFVALGVLPEVGISPANWIDVGIAGGINYNSQRIDNGLFGGPTFSERYRATTFSAGPFLRLYPVPIIFVGLQPEWNWQTIRYTNTLSSMNDSRFKQNSFACLAGVGYSQRVVGQNSFYIMLAADIGGDINSPYRRVGQQGFNPIVRSGFNFYLGRGGSR